VRSYRDCQLRSAQLREVKKRRPEEARTSFCLCIRAVWRQQGSGHLEQSCEA
jgi:hypothetical protein